MIRFASIPATATIEESLIRQGRSEPRINTNWLGWIRLRNGHELPCIVQNASMSGALLHVPSGIGLNATFLLRIEDVDFIFAVAMMWRRGSAVGVRIRRIGRAEDAVNSI